MSEIKTNKISSLTGTNNDITIDPDGTGDTIVASGNVGIGTVSPSAPLSVDGRVTLGDQADSGTAGAGSMIVGAGSLYIQASQNKNSATRVPIVFGNIGGSVETARFDASGNLLVASTTNVGTGDHKVSIQKGTSGRCLGLGTTLTSASVMMSLVNGNGTVGTIQTNGSSTSYVTSSDYRLKENVTATWDATTRLKQLNPVRFNFIADADTTVDGFLAHEVQDVVPEAITGTKDAVDEDGNPDYQGIDQSKLVPLLVKTIQELEARITALEAE